MEGTAGTLAGREGIAVVPEVAVVAVNVLAAVVEAVVAADILRCEGEKVSDRDTMLARCSEELGVVPGKKTYQSGTLYKRDILLMLKKMCE